LKIILKFEEENLKSERNRKSRMEETKSVEYNIMTFLTKKIKIKKIGMTKILKKIQKRKSDEGLSWFLLRS